MKKFILTPEESLLEDSLNFRLWVNEKKIMFPTHHNYPDWIQKNEQKINDLLEKIDYPLSPFLNMLTSKP